jgi:hypothetical protein
MLLSQAGTALGALLWHRAGARLGLSRRQALAVVALSLATPAVLFFTSVMELHAPFLAFAGLSCYFAARWAQQPSWLGAIALGGSTGLAVGAHATAHLLVPWLLLLALGETSQRRAAWQLIAAAGLAHVAVSWSFAPLLSMFGAEVHAGAAARLLLHEGRDRLHLNWLFGVLWRDGLWPFAPLSLTVCIALLREGDGLLRMAVVVGAATSLVATHLLLAPTTENGAYLLPLVWPAALLVVRKLTPAVVMVTLAGGLGLGVAWIVRHTDVTFGRAFAADVRNLGTPQPLVICGEHREFDAFLIFAPDVPWRELVNECNLPPQTVPHLVAGLRAWVVLQAREGRAVLLTAGAAAYLQDPVGDERRTGPLLWAAIQRELKLEPVQGEVLRGWMLRP